jgi:hypothetical protein
MSTRFMLQQEMQARPLVVAARSARFALACVASAFRWRLR